MNKNLLKSTSLVSFMTLMSRVLGFVRDTIAAQIYGATAEVDAFYVAFKIPNFLRNLFAEGCFSQAFVPVFSEFKQHKPAQEVRDFASNVAGALGSALLALTIVCMIAAPLIVMLFAPGYTSDPGRFSLATNMLRLTFPYLLLISLTAFAGAVLNSYGQFGAASFTPVLLNVCMIASAIWLSPHFNIPVEAQAWSVLAAGFVQLAFQMPFLRRLGYLNWPRFHWRDPGVQRVLKLMIPAMFGASIGQVSLLINTLFASFLMAGSITWLYNSERLVYFPLGVFGVALATVVLPHLSSKHASNSQEEYAHTLDWGIRCNLLVGTPATMALLILAGPLVTSLFQYGKFTAYDVLMTQLPAMAYALGLQSFMLVKVLSAGFYARQDVQTPVRIAVVSVIINLILNAVLVGPLKHTGLALAASLSSWFSTALLIFALHRKRIYRLQPGWGVFALRLLFANGVMAALLCWGAQEMNVWLHWGWQERFAHVFLLGVTAITLYVGCLWLSGLRLVDLKVKAVR